MPWRPAAGVEQIIDWAAIDEMRTFASSWHARGRAVHQLPAALGAKLVRADLDPIVLGATRRAGQRHWIYIHARLGGPAYAGVLAHECTHIMQPVVRMQFCGGPFGSTRHEHPINASAAVLAVPLAAVRAMCCDDGSAGTIAEALGAPAQMVRVRWALAVHLREIPGRREHALDNLSAACIGLAAYFWRLSRDLAASPERA